MKSPKLLTLGALAVLAASCGSVKNLQKPIPAGSFDPLDGPGSTSRKSSASVAPTKASYKRGQWVETSMPNATFFSKIPKGSARATKVLPKGTPMKVVSSKGTYVKVELDSGAVGYVPEIMVNSRGSSSTKTTSKAPKLGPVPPPLDPELTAPELAPPPEVPGTPPPVPSAPSIPSIPSVPSVPTVPVPSVPGPSIPSSVPTVPDVAPPPEVPGLTD